MAKTTFSRNIACGGALSASALMLMGVAGVTSAGAADATATPTDTPSASSDCTLENVDLKSSSELTSAVEAAEKAGVKLTEGEESKTIVSPSEKESATETANKSIDGQIASLKEATANAEANSKKLAEDTAAREDIIKQNETITASNAEAQAKYDELVKARDAAIAAEQEVRTANEAITAENKQIEDLNAQQKADYEAKLADYNTKMETYTQLKSEYDQLWQQQVSGADVNTALTPYQLAYAQPFKILDDHDTLKSVDVQNGTKGNEYTSESPSDAIWMYNSDRVQEVQVNNDTVITSDYENVAEDAMTGRKLNAHVVVKNLSVATDNLDGNKVPSIDVYSNFSDAVATWNVAGGEMFVTYTYADDGSNYDHNWYGTGGSLNAQNGKRAEFAAPGEGVLATFLHKDSDIQATAAPIYGQASGTASTGFRVVDQQTSAVSDNSEEALTKLGVTFLMENGGSFKFGTSGTAASETPQGDDIYTYFNHVMFATDTVAPTAEEPLPPVKPEEPTPTPLKPLQDVPTIPEEPKLEQMPLLDVPEEPKAEEVSADWHKVSLAVAPVNLKVDKSSEDTDYSDGFKDYTIAGTNACDIPESIAHDVIITDTDRSGIDSVEISDVQINGKDAGDRVKIDGDKIVVNQIKSGEIVTAKAHAKISNNATEVTNGVTIESPDAPKDNDSMNPNDDLTSDDDQGDILTEKVQLPFDLKNHKSVIDGDASDGKVSFLVEGSNTGPGVAPDVTLADVNAVGLTNMQISDVKIEAGSTDVESAAPVATESAEPVASESATPVATESATAEPSASATAEPTSTESATAEATESAVPTATESADATEDVIDINDLSDFKQTEEGIVIENMASGEHASFVATFDVDPNATEITNSSKITSPLAEAPDTFNPNDSLESDDDQGDKVEVEVPVKETPAPTDSAEPIESATPADSPSSAAPAAEASNPSTPAPEVEVKGNGEAARTGGEAEANGISPETVRNGIIGLVGAAAAIAAGVAVKRRFGTK